MKFLLPSTIGATLVALSNASVASPILDKNEGEGNVELLKVYKNFYSQEDIDRAMQDHKEGAGNYQFDDFSDVVTMKATIMPAFHTKRMLNLIGVQPDSPVEDRYVQIKEIHDSTGAPHIDQTYDDDTLELTYTGETQVGFIFANSNQDASFVYYHGMTDPDEKDITGVVQKVPVEQGDLVVFRGDRLHHTLINSGNVKLIGPFLAKSNNKMVMGDGRARELAQQQKESAATEDHEKEAKEFHNRDLNLSGTRKLAKEQKESAATDDHEKEAKEFHNRELYYGSNPRRRALRNWVDHDLHKPVKDNTEKK